MAPDIFGKAMFNSGQVCVAIKRLYVHESQYDEMVTELAKVARSVKVGNGLEKGTQCVSNSIQSLPPSSDL
jgi:acyl-CoA reductase-like NAD-dependent aldehyde dehydrogenase